MVRQPSAPDDAATDHAGSRPGVPQFDDDAVRSALPDVATVAAALADGFTALGRGDAASTIRVRAAADGAMASAMAAAVPALGVTGGKLYATVDGRFTFHVVLFDLAGQLLCTMGGAALTEVRTPALSAVAIDRWASPSRRIAAVLGTGREALAHVRMLAADARLDEVRVWGRRGAAAAALARTVAADGVPIAVTVAAHSADAVDGADVVVTTTSANEPIVAAEAIADTALVCAVGATKPQRCELDPSLFTRASAVITDSLAGAPHECGDLIHAVAAGHTSWARVVDLAAVLAGDHAVARADVAGAPVIFETQGVALQDVIAAALAWRTLSNHHPT